MKWPVTCPHCGSVFDSLDSYGDSRAMLDEHLLHAHEPKPRTVFGSVLASIAATEDMKDKWFRELLEEKADDDDDRG